LSHHSVSVFQRSVSLSLTILRILAVTSFPYTTLFRSRNVPILGGNNLFVSLWRLHLFDYFNGLILGGDIDFLHPFRPHQFLALRSEEHTSELQSREKLACRPLLAEKKPNMTVPNRNTA